MEGVYIPNALYELLSRLGPARWAVLVVIYVEGGEGMTDQRLALRLGVSPRTARRLRRGAERDGLLARRGRGRAVVLPAASEEVKMTRQNDTLTALSLYIDRSIYAKAGQADSQARGVPEAPVAEPQKTDTPRGWGESGSGQFDLQRGQFDRQSGQIDPQRGQIDLQGVKLSPQNGTGGVQSAPGREGGFGDLWRRVKERTGVALERSDVAALLALEAEVRAGGGDFEALLGRLHPGVKNPRAFLHFLWRRSRPTPGPAEPRGGEANDEEMPLTIGGFRVATRREQC